ncbi:hypothetical protein [Methylobacterium trifolii]|uniref:Uncharacterized protein n=1 Tax=Methylobacterium trifolii TaxID=1003092 RepID=A0ABQ4TSE2_9HYPH|nr:hypothetical protein [Methylobacterium trifolii]GJE58244.1 hypothetical protein MPOCJGCO_0323 [Methylobacterium trifolii]
MSDHMPHANTVVRSSHVLARIADALDVPASAFREPGVDNVGAEPLALKAETALLALVQDHLRRINPEGRTRFLAAVQATVAAMV